MNSKISKELRKLCNPVDDVSRRVYRRLKKQYKNLPRHARRDFIQLVKENKLPNGRRISSASFWVKTRENGKPYLSGQLEIDGKKIPCFIFKNDYQEGNTPHFQIFEVTE